MFNIETVSLDLNNLSINDLKRLTTEINDIRLRKEKEEKKEAIEEIVDFISDKLNKVEGLDVCSFYVDDYDDNCFDLGTIVKGLRNWS